MDPKPQTLYQGVVLVVVVVVVYNSNVVVVVVAAVQYIDSHAAWLCIVYRCKPIVLIYIYIVPIGGLAPVPVFGYIAGNS